MRGPSPPPDLRLRPGPPRGSLCLQLPLRSRHRRRAALPHRLSAQPSARPACRRRCTGSDQAERSEAKPKALRGREAEWRPLSYPRRSFSARTSHRHGGLRLTRNRQSTTGGCERGRGRERRRGQRDPFALCPRSRRSVAPSQRRSPALPHTAGLRCAAAPSEKENGAAPRCNRHRKRRSRLEEPGLFASHRCGRSQPRVRTPGCSALARPRGARRDGGGRERQVGG